MKQRTFNILLTVLFCLFIGGMFLGSLILPDRDFSQLENRKLAQTPALSLENITTGKFMEDAEDYVNDQILGRDFWVALKAWSERVSGKTTGSTLPRRTPSSAGWIPRNRALWTQMRDMSMP